MKADDTAVGVAKANVASQEHQLEVLRRQRDYASVAAPFDGVITQRSVDVGSLVQGDVNSGTFMRNGLQVAVAKDGKAQIRKVRVRRDLGTHVEVDTGVKAAAHRC